MSHDGIRPSLNAADAHGATERPAAEVDDDFAGEEIARSRRLRLRGLRYADIPELSQLYARTTMQSMPGENPTRFIEVAAQVARINRGYAESPGLGVWRADTLDGRFLGTFSLLPVADSDDIQVSVRLMPAMWGRWYAIEGGHLLCQRAFEVMRLTKLLGYCHRDLLPGHRVLTRFGFRDMGAAGDPSGLIHRYELEAADWREARRLHT